MEKITILGVDGAGKTYTSELLKKEAKNKEGFEPNLQHMFFVANPEVKLKAIK